MGHIADAVDKDQQAHECDHHKRHCCERVEHPAEFEPLIADLKPWKITPLPRFNPFAAELEHLHKCGEREQQRQRHGTDSNGRRKPAVSLLGKRTETRRQNRHRRNQPEVLDNPGHVVSRNGVVVVLQKVRYCSGVSMWASRRLTWRAADNCIFCRASNNSRDVTGAVETSLHDSFLPSRFIPSSNLSGPDWWFCSGGKRR